MREHAKCRAYGMWDIRNAIISRFKTQIGIFLQIVISGSKKQRKVEVTQSRANRMPFRERSVTTFEKIHQSIGFLTLFLAVERGTFPHVF